MTHENWFSSVNKLHSLMDGCETTFLFESHKHNKVIAF